MLSETVTKGLDQYEVGQKLRRLRLRKGIGLVELGKHSGLSPAMISKIERGKLYPTLPTLLRLSLVFSVGLEHFFSEPEQRPVFEVVRAKERQRFPDDPEAARPLFHFESLDFKATSRKSTAYLAYFDVVSGDGTEPRTHKHDSIEFVYLVKGELEISTSSGRMEVLKAGDSAYFDASVDHTYRCKGSRPAEAVVVTVP